LTVVWIRSPDEGGLTNGGLVYRYDLEKFKDGLESDEVRLDQFEVLLKRKY